MKRRHDTWFVPDRDALESPAIRAARRKAMLRDLGALGVLAVLTLIGCWWALR